MDNTHASSTSLRLNRMLILCACLAPLPVTSYTPNNYYPAMRRYGLWTSEDRQRDMEQHSQTESPASLESQSNVQAQPTTRLLRMRKLMGIFRCYSWQKDCTVDSSLSSLSVQSNTQREHRRPTMASTRSRNGQGARIAHRPPFWSDSYIISTFPTFTSGLSWSPGGKKRHYKDDLDQYQSKTEEQTT